jgi:cyanophycinase-like exopeptidase
MGVVGLPTSCQIFNTTAITVQQSDGIKPITCNSETIDTETMHSTVTNTSRITIPANKSGYYEIGYAVDTYFPLNGYYAITAIYKNGIVTLIQGTEQKVAQDTPAMTQGMAASTVVYLSGGDYIQLCASTSDVSGNLSISTASGGGVYCFKLDPGVQGSQGYQGDIGVQGIIGPQGLNPGAQGAQGPQDSVGQQGVQGWQGTGAQGYQGWQGLEGLQGRQGWQGWQGTGAQGYQGEQGLQGEQGIQGAQSVQGPQGNQGWQGIQGISGQQGNQGWQGIQGWQGDGAQGPQGINPGPQGDAGSQGVQGINGAQGNQGILGPQGSGIVGAATACQIYNTLGVPVQQSDGIKPMTCDLESIDTDTMHSIVTNTARITIPAGKSGYYEIGYAVDVYYPVAMRTVFLGMYLNGIVNQIRGTEQRVTQDSSAITQGVAASTVVLLNAGDYIQLCASTDDVTNWVSVMLHNGGGVYCFKLDPGVQGTTGVQGNQGWQGRQGNQGWQGNQGCEGWQGIQGLQGEQGAQGWQGWQGTGAQGYQGLQGEQGAQGWQGWQGTGAQGYQGWQGWQDALGRQGSQGWQGWQGEGAQGPQGINPGPQGAQGSVGSQGVGVIGAATACQIYNSTAISVQNSDGIKAITCNSETIDTDTMHSLLTDTSRIVIPAGKSGYYALGYAVDVYFPLNGYYAVLAMYKNGLVTVVQGTKQKVSQDTPTITQGMSASTVVYLAAGEYVQLGASTSDVTGNLSVTTSDGGGVYCFKLDPGVQGPQGDCNPQ